LVASLDAFARVFDCLFASSVVPGGLAFQANDALADLESLVVAPLANNALGLTTGRNEPRAVALFWLVPDDDVIEAKAILAGRASLFLAGL
jgi:hypothetical protein